MSGVTRCPGWPANRHCEALIDTQYRPVCSRCLPAWKFDKQRGKPVVNDPSRRNHRQGKNR